jgi:amidase
VPFLLKDLGAGGRFDGSPSHLGNRALRDAAFVYRDGDSHVVQRLRGAGFIVVGKTNTPELGLGPTTEPRLYGPTRNPWDPTRTPGGSSGGAGAAVASAMVPMAHGNDAGGSIRVPAACCGVFGLKPTRARNPLGPRYGDIMGGLIAEHALTRSVRDSALLLDATAGPDLGDPYAAPPRARAFAREVETPPGHLRVAFSTRTLLGADVHPDCGAAVDDVARLLDSLGHRVVEASPAIEGEEFWRVFTSALSVGFTWAVDDWSRRLGRTPAPELFEPFTWAFVDRGRRFSAPEYLVLVQDLQRISRQVARFFVDHDVWLTPTLSEPPPPLGTFTYTGQDPFALRRRMAEFTPFTYVANATGQPAMSVPLVWSATGLPIGSQFTGRFGDEATLFRLAAQLEAARPWGGRRPALSARR